MNITFDRPVKAHARRGYGTMTHSQSGTIDYNGERLIWHAFRYVDGDSESGKRTSYSTELRRWCARTGCGRELTAARWDGIKLEIRRVFQANVRELAEREGA